MSHNIKNLKKHKNLAQLIKVEFETYGNYGWSIEVFKNELSNENSLYLCYTEGDSDEIIGYIGCWLIQDEAHITTLVVSQKYRRKHIADILLYSLTQELIRNKVKWITLEVKVSNIPAINLYTKYGFKQLGIRKKYYQDTNEDALILWSENIQTDNFKSKVNDIYNSINIKETYTDK